MTDSMIDRLVKDLEFFSNNYEDSCEARNYKRSCILSAIQIVEQYLGYSLSEQTYDEEHTATGTRKIYLYAQPVKNVFSVTVNGIELDPLDYEVFGNYIKTSNQKQRFPKDAVVTIEYVAGYGNRLPDIVKQVILQIATLELSMANENIAVTSVSMPDNSRSFISYTNYNKWLQVLQKLRSFEI